MNLNSLVSELSKLDKTQAASLRDALLDASSSALMEMLVDPAPSVERRRQVAATLASALKNDLEEAA